MEEELNYVKVTFKTNGVSTLEKPNSVEAVYDEVVTGQLAWDEHAPDNRKKAPLCSLLHVVAAGLGIICVLLLSVIIALRMHFNTVMSEQSRENSNLTAQSLQLRMEKADVERQTEELRRERDGLNWTLGVILEYENFPVRTHCPQKVCQPCLDNWVQFQSSCYLFAEFKYYHDWKTWGGSQEECRRMNADLVMIENQEEQEFINNHTEVYNDKKNGYWIGLTQKDVMDLWMWVDGSNLTVMYWRTPEVRSNRMSCALTQPRAGPLANWEEASCVMRNRYICETKVLIRESAALSEPIL